MTLSDTSSPGASQSNSVLSGTVAHHAGKHFTAAVEGYTKAIELNPANAVYFANRAAAHIRLENFGSALEDATKAIELNSKYVKVCMDSSGLNSRSLPHCSRVALRWLLIVVLLSRRNQNAGDCCRAITEERMQT
jgi:tetratricopeptide (TPR) repeat protein